MFRPVHKVTAPVGRHTTLFDRVRQDGGTGGEVCGISSTRSLISSLAELLLFE